MTVMRDTGQSVRNKRAKFESVGWYYMMKFFLFVLRYPLNYKPTRIASYYSSVLSLVPGPKDKFTLAIPDSSGEACTVTSLVYFVPGLGHVTSGISAITNGSSLQVGLMCDST